MDEKTFPAQVVKVISEYRIAINRGSNNGVKIGQRFLLYNLAGEEILDPKTGEPLGILEIPKGTGKVINVQDKLAIIESDRMEKQTGTRTIKHITPHPSSVSAGFFGRGQEVTEETYEVQPDLRRPFDDPCEGDEVKPI